MRFLEVLPWVLRFGVVIVVAVAAVTAAVGGSSTFFRPLHMAHRRFDIGLANVHL